MQDDKNHQEKDQNLRDNADAKNPFSTTSQPVESEQPSREEEADLEQQRKEALTERD